jgi:hypothetical protein
MNLKCRNDIMTFQDLIFVLMLSIKSFFIPDLKNTNSIEDVVYDL